MAVEVMERVNEQEANDTRDTLFLLGGAAMVIFGAGLILATPVVRRHLGGAGIGSLLSAAVPDFQRFLKLRSM
ncbi:MAG TPA: hypothetical protein VK789_02105 [Bryobacteraceae bacterium]|nr:hypothetical protein [Bryobacteraceae bacterium]